jgi:hypothetical protein
MGTFVLAFATVMLWLSTRDLVIDAEKTAERRLRAYLYVDLDIETSDLQHNLDGSSIFKLSPAVKVFGITPAAALSPNWDLRIVPSASLMQLPDWTALVSTIQYRPHPRDFII